MEKNLQQEQKRIPKFDQKVEEAKVHGKSTEEEIAKL